MITKTGFANKILSTIKKERVFFLAVPLISLLYVLVILVYTHGALLFDGDNYGFYHLTSGMFATPTGLLEAFSLIATGSNIYAAFYLYLYLSIFIAVISMAYLSSQLYVMVLPKKFVRISSLISAFIYVIVPFILVDYYSTFIGNVSLASSLFTLFLAFLIRSFRFMGNNDSEFLKSVGVSAVFLGLSVTPFPNDIRTIFVGFVIFFSYLAFTIIQFLVRKTRPLRMVPFMLSVPLFITASLVSSLFMTYSIFANIGATVSSAHTAAANFSNLSAYTGSFDSIVWVIRLIDTWSFPTGYVIYHSIYFHFNLVNLASFFWPLLAVFAPLLIIYKFERNRALLLYVILLVLAAIFWEKSANPPFGSVWYFINSKLPFGYELIPNGTLTYLFLSKFYPALAVFSVVTLYTALKRTKLKILKSKRFRNGVALIVPAFLISMLIVAEMPVFDGQLEANYFNPHSSGFYIPQQYSNVRAYLVNHPGNVLILPGAMTYITFSWNYSGTTYFYNAFFHPVNVTTNQNYGGGYGSSEQVQAFVNITSPILYVNNTAHISTQWEDNITALNYKYILFDKSLTGGQLYENYTYTGTAIQLLQKSGFIKPVFSGDLLTLYKIE